MRTYALVKSTGVRYKISCCCDRCIDNLRSNIRKYNWEIIKEGPMEQMRDQAIILNKLYGK